MYRLYKGISVTNKGKPYDRGGDWIKVPGKLELIRLGGTKK